MNSRGFGSSRGRRAPSQRRRFGNRRNTSRALSCPHDVPDLAPCARSVRISPTAWSNQRLKLTGLATRQGRTASTPSGSRSSRPAPAVHPTCGGRPEPLERGGEADWRRVGEHGAEAERHDPLRGCCRQPDAAVQRERACELVDGADAHHPTRGPRGVRLPHIDAMPLSSQPVRDGSHAAAPQRGSRCLT